MEEHLYTLLSGAVSFPVKRKRHGAGVGLPRAVFHITGGTQDYHMSGRGPKSSRVQIDTYGQSIGQAREAARELENALSGYSGGPVQGAFLQTAFDIEEDDAQILDGWRMIFVVRHSGAAE